MLYLINVIELNGTFKLLLKNKSCYTAALGGNTEFHLFHIPGTVPQSLPLELS